jgi:hypothetical protein
VEDEERRISIWWEREVIRRREQEGERETESEN